MIFRRALIRLTVMYTVVQLLVFGAFAVGIYVFVTQAFDFDVPGFAGDAFVASAEQGFTLLRNGLLVGYAAILAVVPVLSYFMAKRALAPVRQSYEKQERFVEGASHEFRSPLSVIQGELELGLARSRTPTQYRAAMMMALESAEGLTRLTNDLLLLTREDGDELEATFEAVNLNDLAQKITASHDAGARITITASRPFIVNGSEGLLSRAVTNLVDNAAKFSGEHEPIEIEISSNRKVVQIQVSDKGVGMSGAETARAFDRFWRAQVARTTPGFGLGLPLVRQIILAHDGKVSITSELGVGTTVTLTFPELQL